MRMMVKPDVSAFEDEGARRLPGINDLRKSGLGLGIEEAI